MIPALWRLLWHLIPLRYLCEFLFGSWLIKRIWGDEDNDGERQQNEQADDA